MQFPPFMILKGLEDVMRLFTQTSKKNIGIGGKGIIDGRSIAVRASVEEQLQKGISKEMYPIMHQL